MGIAQHTDTQLVARPLLARVAVGTIFFVNGVVLANWISRIPDVKLQLGLSEGVLGLALLAMAVGALVSQPTAGYVIGRIGSRIVTIVMGVLCCAALALVGLASSLPLLMVILFILGACNGSLDVAMNSQAAIVERAYGRSIMNSFHALWSVGGIVGAAVGGIAAANGVAVGDHLLVAAIVTMVIMVVAVRGLVNDRADEGHGAAFALPPRALIPMGVVALCALICEGAVADWGAIFLREDLNSGEGVGATGYAIFALTMAAGRFSGDWLTTRLGPGLLVRGGGVLVVAGITLAVVSGEPWQAILGFGLVGAGVACIFPLIMSAAARTPGVAPGTGIAAMATAGYTGFLIGPPLIGSLAELATLRGALLVLAALGVMIVVLGASVAMRPGLKAKAQQS